MWPISDVCVVTLTRQYAFLMQSGKRHKMAFGSLHFNAV